MLKLKSLISLTLLSISLFANETVEEQLLDCENSYLACSIKCEETENIDISKCVAKCESLYYQCESEVKNKTEDIENNLKENNDEK